ncbi:MAG TPA: deoxyribodipyrimidine photo-lyase [Bacteroidia bacterium]|jgi:deoxyribodipyrimidine photo-lyase|nr:deoxyribodipyrimidine photo-lyase [Bacteroidia bacterium]
MLSQQKETVCIFWFRRDLRLEDNTGLFHALRSGMPVLPLFIFDTGILEKLEDKADGRVHFIHEALTALQNKIVKAGSSLIVMHDKPLDVFRSLLTTYQVNAVFTNTDYEPQAIERDATVAPFLATHHIPFHAFKDQVIFEKNEIQKDDGTPYTVFTPYMKKWKAALKTEDLSVRPVSKHLGGFLKTKPFSIPSLQDIGFQPVSIAFPPAELNESLLEDYASSRDFPARQATSRLSVHLRFGTISIRALVLKARAFSETWMNELIWREFYMMILFHYPHVTSSAFKPAYDRIRWRNNEEEFARWCSGNTGFPIVDAGMRELNETGFMHNRLRMITASFLVKDLLIDWRWGEAYFAQKLLDFELASNNGGWQWSAGTGCDSAPYFRIFSPSEQTRKFDPQHEYIRKWVPEWQELSYPAPMTDHKFARVRTLEAFKSALSEDKA